MVQMATATFFLSKACLESSQKKKKNQNRPLKIVIIASLTLTYWKSRIHFDSQDTIIKDLLFSEMLATLNMMQGHHSKT